MMYDTPQPLYRRVKQYIADRIAAGVWQVGQRLPSEHELAAQFDCARMTVNRAVRELTDEGRLVRLQGVGTFVAQPKAQSALFEVRSIADEIRARGHRHGCRVLAAAAQTDAAVAASLGLPSAAGLFHTQLVHDEDGMPIQYEDRWVNPSAAPDYLQQDFTVVTPHDYLTEVAPFSEGEHIIEARMPPKAVAEVLAMARGEPCLVVERRTWSGNLAVTFVRLWFPAGRYRLQGRFAGRDA